MVRNLQVQSMGQEDPLEGGMATHPSIPAGTIPWTESLQAAIHGLTKSQTRLSRRLRTHFLNTGLCWTTQRRGRVDSRGEWV